MTRRYDVTDLALAATGRARIAKLEQQLPVLATVREQFETERPLAGFRISACLPVRAETAALARTLQAAGADLLVCAPRPSWTHDDVAAALVEDLGVPTFARANADAGAQYAHLDAAADHKPHVVLDDGAELIGLLHSARREQLGEVIAATEASPVGLLRLRALAEDGALAFPVLAVAESAIVRLVSDRPGAGRVAVDELAAGEGTLAGRRIVVEGYGPAGVGAAAQARALGAVVHVREEEPLRRLEAVLDGFDLVPVGEEPYVDAVVVPTDAPREPAAVDLLLSVQALATAAAARSAASLERQVHPVPPELDREVARVALEHA